MSKIPYAGLLENGWRGRRPVPNGPIFKSRAELFFEQLLTVLLLDLAAVLLFAVVAFVASRL